MVLAGASIPSPDHGEFQIALKPNYQFERKERERLKALKAAEKAEAKRLQRARDEASGRPTDDVNSQDESE